MKALNHSSFQVIYGRRTKRVSVERAIASKVAFFPKLVTRYELLVLYDNVIWLQEKAETDPDFAKKFGIYLKVLSYILKHHRDTDSLSQKSVQQLSDSFLKNVSGFLLKKRHTKQATVQSMSRIEVRPSRQMGLKNSSLPPATYIGKGYRDKGTAKKPWLDGSPSWQEIASQPIGSLQ